MMKIFFLASSLLVFSFNTISYAHEQIEDESTGPSITHLSLLKKKTEAKQKFIEISEGWYDARLITPGTHVYLKTKDTYALHKNSDDATEVELYCCSPEKGNKSRAQVIINDSGLSVAACVDTSIHTSTKRKDEKKATYIQYDKTQIIQHNKDFKVDAVNENGKANYDGGHLIDHKFSAHGSHTNESNYIPQHHFYNRWLKEHLVKSVEGYIEIPLFTSNPPTIKVLSESRYDVIPIGILLITLSKANIHVIHYFPNNQYNYRLLQKNLKITNQIAEGIASNFQLKKELHALLLPAIIHDIKEKGSNLNRQFIKEAKGMEVVTALIDGMSVLDLEEGEEVLATLASNVIHQDNVELSNVLNNTENRITIMNLNQPNPQALSQSFNALGQFLVNYSMKNSLKSETLSTYSRIMFANIITDFMECSSEVSPQALNRVDDAFKDVYMNTLNELWNVKEQMTLNESIYFANLYQKLSSPFIEPSLYEGYQLSRQMSFEGNLIRFIYILENLIYKTSMEPPSNSQMQNLVSLFIEAQTNLSYSVCNGYPFEEFKQQSAILKESKKMVHQWDQKSQALSGHYQTSPNSICSFRMLPGLNKDEIKFLGTASSCSYENDEEEFD